MAEHPDSRGTSARRGSSRSEPPRSLLVCVLKGTLSLREMRLVQHYSLMLTAPTVLRTGTSALAVGTGTILLAEDEPALRTLTRLMLEGSGYSVLLAKDGREAIDVFQQNASEIAIVLLDMAMPVMGGKEAFRLIRKIRPDVPVIILTGYSDDIARKNLGAVGSVGFLQKPYSAEKLIAEIRASLEESAVK
jgi:CheY-like chemotaxis protein